MENLETLKKQIHAARATAALLPHSREAALVKTKLDEAALWASTVSTEFGPSVGTLDA